MPPLGYIKDGASNTILVAEKGMASDLYLTGTWYWDEPFFLGGSGGTARWGTRLVRDGPGIALATRGQWGSAHANGVQLLMVDAAVRPIKFGSDEIMPALLSPQGREPTPEF